ncbi:MAG: hypothetical protein JNL56_12220 [Alphaproteobacteria bacterium]|nr:hypothetical protein [Alphaproteobacteria bacterium]
MFALAALRPLLAAAALALTVGSATAATADLAPEGDADMASALSGARADLADARAYLAELEAGHFEGIFAVDGETLRCGEPSAQTGCAPLTQTDKAEAIAEAREMVVNATAQLSAAQSAFAAAGGVEAVAIAD